jgi:hypothetical protein
MSKRIAQDWEELERDLRGAGVSPEEIGLARWRWWLGLPARISWNMAPSVCSLAPRIWLRLPLLAAG